MRNLTSKGFSIFILFFSGAVFAEGGLNYNYVEFSYETGEIDVGFGIELDFSGISLSGSFEINETVFFTTSYATGKIDDINADIDGFVFGLGAHFDLTEDSRTHFVGELSLVRAEVDVPGYGSDSDTDESITMGIRHLATDELELQGGLTSSGDTSFYAGGYALVSKDFSVGFIFSNSDDSESLNFSARFNI